MNEYRITKYDPQYRVNGVYERYDWSSVSDVGREFFDGILTQETCDRVIGHYVSCVMEIMKAAGIQNLTVQDMEDWDLRFDWYSGKKYPLKTVAQITQACLEEKCWCKLVAPEAFVHFGYELYMYVGCSLAVGEVRNIAARYGLFVEAFHSPYSETVEAEEASPIFFSTESQAPAADGLMDCLLSIERRMNVPSLAPYTDALDAIGIIPYCVSAEWQRDLQLKERRYISWKNREADIRLEIPFEPFVRGSKAEKMQMARDLVKRSLEVVQMRCEKKKVRFDLDALLRDVFTPSPEA